MLAIAIGCGAAVCGSLGWKPEVHGQKKVAKAPEERRKILGAINIRSQLWSVRCVFTFGGLRRCSAALGLFGMRDLWLKPQATARRCSAANRRGHAPEPAGI